MGGSGQEAGDGNRRVTVRIRARRAAGKLHIMLKVIRERWEQ